MSAEVTPEGLAQARAEGWHEGRADLQPQVNAWFQRAEKAEAERDAALRDVAILRPAAAHAERAEAELRALRDAVAALAGEWAMRGMRNKSRVWVESSADLLALLSDGPSA